MCCLGEARLHGNTVSQMTPSLCCRSRRWSFRSQRCVVQTLCTEASTNLCRSQNRSSANECEASQIWMCQITKTGHVAVSYALPLRTLFTLELEACTRSVTGGPSCEKRLSSRLAAPTTGISPVVRRALQLSLSTLAHKTASSVVCSTPKYPQSPADLHTDVDVYLRCNNRPHVALFSSCVGGHILVQQFYGFSICAMSVLCNIELACCVQNCVILTQRIADANNIRNPLLCLTRCLCWVCSQ